MIWGKDETNYQYNAKKQGFIPIAMILKNLESNIITRRILQAVATFKSQLQNTIDLIMSFRGLFSSELLRPLGR